MSLGGQLGQAFLRVQADLKEFGVQVGDQRGQVIRGFGIRAQPVPLPGFSQRRFNNRARLGRTNRRIANKPRQPNELATRRPPSASS